VTSSSSPGNDDVHDLGALAAYLEHRLDDQERARLEDHLATCGECRATLATYARAASEDPDLDARPRASGLRMVPAAWLALAAGAVLAIGASIYLSTNQPIPAGDSREPAPPARAPAPAAPAPAAVPSSPPASSPAAGTTGDLSRMRSVERRVGGKTFRLEAGTWVDKDYDPVKFLPVTEISTEDERRTLLQSQPALEPYAALGAKVVVAVDGKVYRFDVR